MITNMSFSHVLVSLFVYKSGNLCIKVVKSAIQKVLYNNKQKKATNKLTKNPYSLFITKRKRLNCFPNILRRLMDALE